MPSKLNALHLPPTRSPGLSARRQSRRHQRGAIEPEKETAAAVAAIRKTLREMPSGFLEMPLGNVLLPQENP
jgi:hypothetical protein